LTALLDRYCADTVELAIELLKQAPATDEGQVTAITDATTRRITIVDSDGFVEDRSKIKPFEIGAAMREVSMRLSNSSPTLPRTYDRESRRQSAIYRAISISSRSPEQTP